MLFLFLIAVSLAIIKGAYDGFTDGLKGVNRYAPIYEEPETPYYIDEQIEAILEQIHANHIIINRLEESIEITSNLDKLAALEKKKADTLYKVARLEEKLQNLLEKWDG